MVAGRCSLATLLGHYGGKSMGNMISISSHTRDPKGPGTLGVYSYPRSGREEGGGAVLGRSVRQRTKSQPLRPTCVPVLR